jgi:hypothetical protein
VKFCARSPTHTPLSRHPPRWTGQCWGGVEMAAGVACGYIIMFCVEPLCAGSAGSWLDAGRAGLEGGDDAQVW